MRELVVPKQTSLEPERFARRQPPAASARTESPDGLEDQVEWCG